MTSQRLRDRTPHIPNSELLAAALRYRTPTSPKAIPTERFAIALPKLQNSDRLSIVYS
ncbi:hypothetical protein PN471_01870 [Aphanizomenon sp. CS-733/32]|uniref:hypothetical protein n=1 Tax=Aphanizomenon sp. CS-733/32 TaxID=3021715 RepID=UPI00232EE705|nr:hypothetical protein [Aphanizomenon sp. CS-733/32]MDB9307417.1 hypothetical protein [Aphanizomenon sp. CS-733/32]